MMSHGIDPYEPCTESDEGIPWWLGVLLIPLLAVICWVVCLLELLSKAR